MDPSIVSLLRCPACRATLQLDGEQLRCTQCAAVYPVVAGIPRFVPKENYAANFGFQWNRFRQTQLDSHSGVSISRRRFLEQTGWTAADLAGKRVLDAGCGAGRFAEIALSLGAEVVAIDYSSAVDACAANLGDHPRLNVMQADIYALPFAPGTFDFIYSLGVLQHTPDVKRALLSLPPFLRPAGSITVDLYLKNAAMWTHPRVWLRPMTTRIDGARLFSMVERWAPALLRVSRALDRVPVAGRFLRRMVPVANYEGALPLDDRQLTEWAILDTYDWLAPKYDQPQTAPTLRAWLTEAGLDDVEVVRAHHLTGRGRKPAA
jgi:SAM-dependent methyltransferase